MLRYAWLSIVRGDNTAIVGEIDEEADAQLDLNEMVAEPLNETSRTA